MSRPRAPTAIRRPISRVRSVTETSMMFMMPTPPTTSEMSATIRSSEVMSAEVEVIASSISLMLRSSKSSSPPAGMRWRSRSSAAISSIAASTRSAETALHWMLFTLSKRIGMR